MIHLKKIIIILFGVLVGFVFYGNLQSTSAIERLPKVLKSNYYISNSDGAENTINVILYDNEMSKFSYLENYKDVYFEDENTQISVGLPKKVEVSKTEYLGCDITANNIFLQPPLTNISLLRCKVVFVLKDNQEYKFNFGDLVFAENKEINENEKIELLGKHSVINNDTLIPEAAGYVLYLKAKKPVTLKSFNFSFTEYGIDTKNIVCEKVEIESALGENDVKEVMPKKVISNTSGYSLGNLELQEGTYTIQIPFTVTKENPNTIFQLGGQLTYEHNQKIQTLEISGMTFMSINYIEENVIKGALKHE